MQPYPPHQQIKIRRPIVIFLKSVGTPIVLYVDDSEATYNEIRQIILNASEQSPKLIEKIGKGPVKKISLFDTQIAAVVLQEENFAG